MRNSSSLKYIFFTLAVVAIVWATVWSIGRFAATFTPSLRYSFFYLSDRPDKSINRGDFVVFRMINETTIKLKIYRVIKEVVCLPGDELAVRNRDYYCNNKLLGSAREMSPTGEKVSSFNFSGKIPQGRLFVMGHTIDSIDSRYFGFVRTDDVEKIAYPIF